MNVFERTFRDYAALSYNKDDKSEYEKAMEWAANELTRLSALEERCGDVEGMWISVKDRLPEKRQEALFWFPNELGAIMMGRYLGEGRWSYGGLVYTSVTHWQPLPDPPREGPC